MSRWVLPYVPTAGMLAALDDPEAARPFDVIRCRLRGLLNVRHQPTAAGWKVLNAERIRRAALNPQHTGACA